MIYSNMTNYNIIHYGTVEQCISTYEFNELKLLPREFKELNLFLQLMPAHRTHGLV